MKNSCSYMHAAVQLGCNGATLASMLAIPEDAESIIILIRNSDGGGYTHRSRFLTDVFNEAGFAVLSLDLLTDAEKVDTGPASRLLNDISVLTARLLSVIDWVVGQPVLKDMHLGLFGGDNGAAVALNATAKRTNMIVALVACGGHTELAAKNLADIRTPTLFIAGAKDRPVIDSHRKAAQALAGPHHIEMIPNASRYFTEKGTLKAAVGRACHWFMRHLAVPNWVTTKAGLHASMS